MAYKVLFTKEAQKDALKLKAAQLALKAQKLCELLAINPWKTSPPYEKLIGDLAGKYSRRINIQHRLVYEVLMADKVVKILKMWTHYE